jgi:hypothetical protein
MSRDAGTAAPTQSIPFIYLRARGKESLAPKKARFPSSLQTLIKICNTLFQGYGTVRSLFTSEGKQVRSLDDVIPGSTLFVSSIEPDMQPIETTLVSLQEPPRASEQLYSAAGFQRLFGPAQPDNDPAPEPAPARHRSTAPTQSRDLPQQRSTSDQSQVQESRSDQPQTGSPSPPADASDPAPSDQLQGVPEQPVRHGEGSGTSEQFARESVSKLFNFSEASINSLLLQSLGGTSDWVQSLLGSVSQLEADQMRAWFQFGHAYFATLGPGFDDAPLFASDEISGFIRNVITRHRFAYSCGTSYRMRLGIAGPRFSGKSRLLLSFADEILLEYAATGLWKRTFFVMFNFRLLSPFLSDMNDFYVAIVDLTLQNLVWQRPFLQQFRHTITKFLLLVTTSKSCPRIPVHGKFFQECQHFAVALQKILEKLFAIWTDPARMNDWLLSVFLLPLSVSAAVGFSNVFYFADNIEFVDLDLTATVPFVGPHQSCLVAEFFKFALSRGNFIVAAENQDKLPEILEPLGKNGFSLMPDIEIITPAGVLNADDQRTIIFDIQDEAMPFQLTADHCSGIPAFVALWNELNDAFDEFEQVPPDEKDEFLVLLIAQAQHVIDVLFAVPDSTAPLFVTSVRKKEAV